MVLELREAWFRPLSEGVVSHGHEENTCVFGVDGVDVG